jgi:L-tartrate/succinate antiporter
VGVVLLVAVPLLAYFLYPPEVKSGEEVPKWAATELVKMGSISRRELTLAILVVVALSLWIFGGAYVDATTAALVVISLMLLTGVVTWDDITANKQAWNTLAWFATLVALADGLNRVGFVKWLANAIAAHMAGFSPTAALIVLVLAFFFLHYMFASVTAHVTALLPVMLAVGSTVPGLPMQQLAGALLLTLGIMGILTPYATGPSPVYYGSGYIPSGKFWQLGAIFGVIYIAALLLIGLPWNAVRG